MIRDVATAAADLPARIAARADALDRAAYQRVARADTPRLDRVLPGLSTAANHGRLWLAVAVGLAATRRPPLRRAALRGGFALALASPVANVVGKGVVRRPRPGAHEVPLVRLLTRAPRTTSFPSGHSASAAAFATGVALESPPAALPVGLLAAAVAYSRVHTGVHYPGDVVAGCALGATAALTTTLLWPRRPEYAALARPAGSDARLERRLGKWPATAVALTRVLRAEEPFDVAVDGRVRRLWLFFAGASYYAPAGFAPSWRPRLDDGLLDLRLVDPTRPLARTRLVAAVLLGRLGRTGVYEERRSRAVRLRPLERPLRFARDGEVEDGPRTEAEVAVRPHALLVYRPVGATRP